MRCNACSHEKGTPPRAIADVVGLESSSNDDGGRMTSTCVVATGFFS